MLTYPLSAHLAPPTPSQHALRQLSVLSVLAAVPLVNFATPLAPTGRPSVLLPLAPALTSTLLSSLKTRTPWLMRFTRSTLPGVQSTSSPTPRARCIRVCRCSVSRYRAHLSKEVAKLVAPHPDTPELVHSWFVHHSVKSSSISTTHGGSWLTVTGGARVPSQ
ncbi:hypothetical protein EDB84DRAFT_1478556 [Lactarius hengduanensis]|nr:hypothetical protein EDB84DRAFT_1478556 [Lactarius hengduanensis]